MSETSVGEIRDDEEPVDCKGRGNWDVELPLPFGFDIYIYFLIII